MRIGLKMLVVAGIGLAMFQWVAAAADQKPATPPGDTKPAFKDDREKASYALGANVGTFIKRNNMDMDIDVLTAALISTTNSPLRVRC
jgi:hypothetical protein